MKRIILLLILSIFLVSCAERGFENERNFDLSDGQKVKVFLEEKDVRKNETILLARYKIDERILREETVEKHILEIWKKLESIAEEKNLEDGIIEARYFAGKDAENPEKDIYEDFLFEAEKIENGTWKIRKVN